MMNHTYESLMYRAELLEKRDPVGNRRIVNKLKRRARKIK